MARRKVIKASDMQSYTVTVNFGGYIGADETYTVTAASAEDAENQAVEDAKDDLEIIDVEDEGGGEYDVTIGFCGFIGVEEKYTVIADDEDEAGDAAIDEAFWDLTAEVEG